MVSADRHKHLELFYPSMRSGLVERTVSRHVLLPHGDLPPYCPPLARVDQCLRPQCCLFLLPLSCLRCYLPSPRTMRNSPNKRTLALLAKKRMDRRAWHLPQSHSYRGQPKQDTYQLRHLCSPHVSSYCHGPLRNQPSHKSSLFSRSRRRERVIS